MKRNLRKNEPGAARRWTQAGVLLAGGCLLLTVSGCAAGGKAADGGNGVAVQQSQPPAADKPVSVQPSPSGAASAGKLPFVNPLTGVGSEHEVKERPIAVMVENAPQARPQSGLDQADIVYEILAEGEITRFEAIYQSHAAKVIGPVRSARPYYVEIASGLDSVYVHAGWSQDAMNLIEAKDVDHFDQVYGDGAYYWRSDERKAPHNLYTSTDKIRQGMQKKKIRSIWNDVTFAFAGSSGAKGGNADSQAVSAAVKGEAATKVTIPYLHGYNVSYEYDAATGLYNRFMEGKPHVDKETGHQLTAANVLIIETKHKVLDSAGRREVDVTGPGNGVLVQKGRKLDITWERKGGAIKAFAAGREVPLVPGQTWVQVVPEGTTLAWN